MGVDEVSEALDWAVSKGLSPERTAANVSTHFPTSGDTKGTSKFELTTECRVNETQETSLRLCRFISLCAYKTGSFTTAGIPSHIAVLQ